MKKQNCDNKKEACCCSSLNGKLFMIAIGLVVVVVTIWVFTSNQKVVKQGNTAQQLAQDFNVQLDVPMENIGSLDDIPKEKIDSLFSDIKE